LVGHNGDGMGVEAVGDVRQPAANGGRQFACR
jgi:hypothetical protein